MAIIKRIPVWKNVVLILSAFIIVVIATLAWFYTGPTANAGLISAQVGKATYIQVSGDNGNNWSEELDTEFGANRNFKEISGNGSLFFAPDYDSVEGDDGSISTQLVSFESADPIYYFEQVIDLRSDTAQNIYLSPESVVASVDAQGNGFIDGALRIAFFELDADGNETLRFIWAPNSTVEYFAATNSFTREGGVEPYYYYQKSLNPVDVGSLEKSSGDVAKISTENTDESGCGYNSEYKFMWSNGQNMPADAPYAVTLDDSGDDNLFYKRLKIRVWLEGHDRECVSLLNGQKFTMKLRFYAKEGE